MRMYVGTKASGEKIKAKIKDAIDNKKYGSYFSLGNVYEIGFEKKPAAETFYQGWPRDILRKNMRLRQVKNGDWFLYVPDPIDLTFGGTMWCDELPEKVDKPSDYIKDAVCPGFNVEGKIDVATQLSVRCCRVISRKKNTTITEYGFFHRWSHSRMPNSDGDIIEQELGIVEFKDGSIRQIRPDHIIFGWEE